MATKLRVDTGPTHQGKKLWERHQKNEYKRVNQYKEGYCFNCFSNKAVAATIVTMCEKCFDKRGAETILAKITDRAYGMCFFCGKYDFKTMQYNVRLCHKCFRRVADILKAWNLKGGMFGNDPFWKAMQRRSGQDWKALMFEPPKRKAL